MTKREGFGFASASRGVVLMSVALLGAVGILAQPLGRSLQGLAGAATAAAPYTDSNVVGSIGLCNQSGQQITQGSTTARPFAWRAVSTQAAQAPYNNAGRTATLVVYLPQQGLPAGDWSGTELTASSSYTNPAFPMAAVTAGDESLANIVEEFPPKWNGFLQLRMYLDTANRQPYETQYPSLNIQVTGDTWQAVGGSPVNCASGTAQSFESVVLPSTTTTTPSTSASPTTTPTTVSGKGTSSSTGPGSPVAGSKGASRNSAAASSTPATAVSASSNVALILGIGLPLLAILAGLAYFLRRRRLATHAPGSGSETASPTSSPTKGDSQ
jgi:hypothetical protein